MSTYQSTRRIEEYLRARLTPPHPAESDVIDAITSNGVQYELRVSDLDKLLDTLAFGVENV